MRSGQTRREGWGSTRRTALGVVLLALCTCGTPTPSPPDLATVSLSEAALFTTPGGDPVSVPAGEYRLAPAEGDTLALRSTRTSAEWLLAAERRTHDEPLDAPLALSEPGDDGQRHLVLLLADGGLREAVGSDGEVMERGARIRRGKLRLPVGKLRNRTRRKLRLAGVGSKLKLAPSQSSAAGAPAGLPVQDVASQEPLPFPPPAGASCQPPQRPGPIDPNAFYRLTTQWLGPGKALDIVNDSSDDKPVMADVGDFSGQLWKITPLGGGFHRLTTQFQGPGRSLDVVNDGRNDRLILAPTGNFSGQSWLITPEGVGTFRLTTEWQGPGKSLDIANDGRNDRPVLATSGNFAGQLWRITKDRVVSSPIGRYAKRCLEAIQLDPDDLAGPFCCHSPQAKRLVSTVDGRVQDIGVCSGPGCATDIPTKCDFPTWLDNKCYGNSSIQVLPTPSNAKVKAVMLCRHKFSWSADPRRYDDIAIIAHNEGNGETCWFQAEEAASLNGLSVPGPMQETGESTDFWFTPDQALDVSCVKCHDSGPWMNSRWMNNAIDTEMEDASATPYHNSTPPFDSWPDPRFVRLDPARDELDGELPCTSCHKIAASVQNIAGSIGEPGFHTCEEWIPRAVGRHAVRGTPPRSDRDEYLKRLSATGDLDTNDIWMHPFRTWTRAEWDQKYRRHVDLLVSCCKAVGRGTARPPGCQEFRPRPGCPVEAIGGSCPHPGF